MGFPTAAIIVYSCLAGTSFADFDPHKVGASLAFVRSHPQECREDPPVLLSSDVTLEECSTQSFLHMLPSWKIINPEREWLGARCEPHKPEFVIRPHDQEARIPPDP